MTWREVQHGLAMVFVVCLSGCAPVLLFEGPQVRYYEELKTDKALIERFAACSRPQHHEQTLVTHLVALDAGSLAQELSGVVAKLKGRELRSVDLGGHLGAFRGLKDLMQSLRRERWSDDEQAAQGKPARQLLVAYTKAYFSEEGFVDRNGHSLAFPAISAEVQISGKTLRFHADTPSSPRVAADLTRIFLEALLDTVFQVPADPKATALRAGWEPGYPRIDPAQSPVRPEQFSKVMRDGLKAEAAVIHLIGTTERGAGPFGIQNETAAAAVETAAGVIAKKITEHEVYCYYWAKSSSQHTAGN